MSANAFRLTRSILVRKDGLKLDEDLEKFLVEKLAEVMVAAAKEAGLEATPSSYEVELVKSKKPLAKRARREQ